MRGSREAQDGAEGSRGRRREVLVAVIAVCAAILGALAGGAATYLGNKSLESSKDEKTARGGARVLRAQLRSVDIRLSTMLSENRLYEIDQAYRVGLSDDDEQLIASEVSAADWARVASALAAVELYATGQEEDQQRANAGLRVGLDSRRREYIKSTRQAVVAGMAGLRELAEGD